MVALLDRLLLIADMLQRDMARAFDGTDLTPSRTHLLWEVHHRGPSTQRTLASALGVSARNITGLVDALETSGHVERRVHETDRRAHLVALTARGGAAMTAMARDHAQVSETLRDAVDVADRDALDRGLDAVTARLAALIAEDARARGEEA